METNQNIREDTWCKFEAYGETQLLGIESFSFSIAFIVIIIFIVWIRKKNISGGSYSTIEKFIFIGVIVWLFSLIAKNTINILAFEKIMKNHVLAEEEDKVKQLTHLSIAFTIFDYFTTFTILFWLFSIPSIWLKSIFLKVDEKKIIFKQRVQISKLFKFLKIIRIYIFFRFIYPLYPICLLFISFFQGIPHIINSVTYLIILGQSLFLFIFYLIGLISMLKFRKLLNFEQESLKQFICEYICLLLVCFSRILYNLIQNLFNTGYSPKNNYCLNSYDNQIPRIWAFGIAFTILHFVPIFLIFFIYWPVDRSSHKSTTLMQSDNGYSKF